ncbi:MAG: triose-phosphate isomerase [Endomicrobium sp.]|jgi:triosephosphate isomerase|nr:triose-phosphate isomerase [Endomicrobium sp.]
MRKPLMAGNWKMNKTVTEAVSVVKVLKSSIFDVTDVEVLICPAFTALYVVNSEVNGSNINIGAQNLFWEPKGAFTGEISSVMLKDIGCSYVLIGHSERRQYFNETDKSVNKKTKAALVAGLIPVICIGETFKEKEQSITFEAVEKQIKEGLVGLTPQQATIIVIAYEPVWAIGTGKIATPDQTQKLHIFIRKVYSQMYGYGVSQKIRILYGGSVNPTNVSDFMRQPDIDGCLAGGASLEVESFIKLVKYSK